MRKAVRGWSRETTEEASGELTPERKLGQTQKLPEIYFLKYFIYLIFNYHTVKLTFLFWCTAL